ncbi:putative nsp2F protein [Kafue kinda chacma baboon virus]|uniref:Putative nsp2F protein n=2 Tax=Kafue kinda chacma baboon virus TaxID=1823757 RepID=A0A0Y0B411_9NIDO|nr:putative nsp2F protein [Kafue kinda chacma baboon virus]AMB20709.1 putative nsp2F protein [Kafue kinda chacma baboon virus]
MICQCEFRGHVVMVSNRMVCIYCGHLRQPTPRSRELLAFYGPVIQYVDITVAGDYINIKDKLCLTSLVAILRGATRGFIKRDGPQMIRTLSAVHGDLSREGLFKEFGMLCYGVVRAYGPVLGAVGYLSPGHMSTDHFDGSTHAIVAKDRWTGDERPDDIPHYAYAYMMYQYGTNTIHLGNGSAMWTRGVTPGVEIAPMSMVEQFDKIVKAFPESMLCPLSWIGEKQGSLNFLSAGESCLAFQHGDCWTQLFEDPSNEFRIASTFGYQLANIGVPGKYIARRLQINGLKLVHDANGKFCAWRVIKGSWIGHIGPHTESPPEGFALIARFSILPYNQYSSNPLFKLPGKVYFGGNASTKFAVSDYNGHLQYSDALTPGFCWLQLFPPLERTGEASRAILAGQVNANGVTGTYLNYRLSCLGLSAVECDYGEHFVYHAASDPSVLHISPIPLHDAYHIFVTRLTVTRLCAQGYDFGFGVRYGRRKRRGGGKASEDEWAKAVDQQEGKTVPEPAPKVPSITFGAPPDELPRSIVSVESGLVNKPTIPTDSCHLPNSPNAPIVEIYSPPPDGGCGIHALAAVAHHLRHKSWPKIEPMVNWGYQQWADSEIMGELACDLGLPLGFESCTHQPYIIALVDNHFVVRHYPSRTPTHSPTCQHGCCHTLVGTATVPTYGQAGDFNVFHKLLPRFKDAAEFIRMARALLCQNRVCHKPIPPVRKTALVKLMATTPSTAAKVPPSEVRSILKPQRPTPDPRTKSTKAAPAPPPAPASPPETPPDPDLSDVELGQNSAAGVPDECAPPLASETPEVAAPPQSKIRRTVADAHYFMTTSLNNAFIAAHDKATTQVSLVSCPISFLLSLFRVDNALEVWCYLVLYSCGSLLISFAYLATHAGFHWVLRHSIWLPSLSHLSFSAYCCLSCFFINACFHQVTWYVKLLRRSVMIIFVLLWTCFLILLQSLLLLGLAPLHLQLCGLILEFPQVFTFSTFWLLLVIYLSSAYSCIITVFVTNASVFAFGKPLKRYSFAQCLQAVCLSTRYWISATIISVHPWTWCRWQRATEVATPEC